MSFIEWDEDKFSVGVSALDRDHMIIADLIDQFHDAHAAGKGEETLENIFQVLMAYTLSHFEREEALMEKAGYADLQAHRAGHEKLKDDLGEMHARFIEHEVGVVPDMLAFLNNWWHFHILEKDHAYIGDLRAHGLTDKP